MSKLTPEIRILPATPADIPALANIFALNYHTSPDIHLFTTLLLGYGHTVEDVVKWCTPGLEKKFREDEREWPFKAIDEGDQVVGYGRVTFNKAEDIGEIVEIPENAKFDEYFFGKLNNLWKEMMRGRNHFYWTSLFVLPSHQGLGIGTQLLAYGFPTYELDQAVLFVPAFPMASKLYGKFGLVEKGLLEVNFGDERWGGKDRGFGVSRTSMMVREAGKM